MTPNKLNIFYTFKRDGLKVFSIVTDIFFLTSAMALAPLKITLRWKSLQLPYIDPNYLCSHLHYEPVCEIEKFLQTYASSLSSVISLTILQNVYLTFIPTTFVPISIMNLSV